MINYTTDIQPREGDGVTDEAIAQAVNADPARYQPVASKYLGAWAALGGRLFKLESFVAAPNGGDPQMIGMQSAVKMTLQLLANPTTEIFVAPGHPHRQLLDALVSINVLTADDLTQLVDWYGRLYPAVTAADVASAREAHVAYLARDAAMTALASADSRTRAAIDRGDDLAPILAWIDACPVEAITP